MTKISNRKAFYQITSATICFCTKLFLLFAMPKNNTSITKSLLCCFLFLLGYFVFWTVTIVCKFYSTARIGQLPTSMYGRYSKEKSVPVKYFLETQMVLKEQNVRKFNIIQSNPITLHNFRFPTELQCKLNLRLSMEFSSAADERPGCGRV